MVSVFIDGAAGTTGLRLRDRLLARDDIRLIEIPSNLRKDEAELEKRYKAADFVFLCLPDGAAIAAAERAEGLSCRLIDCSTAHRTASGWVYGFPEITKTRRGEILNSRKVAVPGCYAGAFVAIARPLTNAGLLNKDADVSFFGISGYSGAGNGGIEQYENPGRGEELSSPRLYALGQTHKHLPEITAQSGLSKPPVFSPIICDFPCGMTVTMPVFGYTPNELLRTYVDFYAGERLISVLDEAALPSGFLGANNLAGKDTLQIIVAGNETEKRATVTARLDNLGKGASGAAIQCLNIMSGAEETAGLCL